MAGHTIDWEVTNAFRRFVREGRVAFELGLNRAELVTNAFRRFVREGR